MKKKKSATAIDQRYSRARQHLHPRDVPLVTAHVARKILHGGVRIRRRAVQRVSPFEEQRQAASGIRGAEKGAVKAEAGSAERRARTREILSQLSSPGSPSAAIFRRCSEKPTRRKLARFVDRHASRNPTCFLSAPAHARLYLLSDNLSLPIPVLSLSLSPPSLLLPVHPYTLSFASCSLSTCKPLSSGTHNTALLDLLYESSKRMKVPPGGWRYLQEDRGISKRIGYQSFIGRRWISDTIADISHLPISRGDLLAIVDDDDDDVVAVGISPKENGKAARKTAY